MKLIEEDSVKYEQSPFKIDYSLSNLVRMNLNENLVLPASFLRSVIVRCVDKLDSRLYPSEMGEGEVGDLETEISKYCNCSTENVCIGNGSDQLIDLLCRVKLTQPSNRLVTVDPTFSMYAIDASRTKAKVVKVALNPSTSSHGPFSLDEKKLIRTCKSKDVKMLALASPNNPTGIQYPIEQVRTIIESLPSVSILLDEAYVEFGRYNATRLLGRYPNLIILRTFSKAFGLASHRLGYFLSSDREFVSRFKSEYQYPFPITALSAMMGAMLLKRKAEILEFANKTKELRTELASSIERLDKQLRVIPASYANFVVVQADDAKKIALELLTKYRIALKYLPKMGQEREFLRITVGTRQINERLLYALRRIGAS